MPILINTLEISYTAVWGYYLHTKFCIELNKLSSILFDRNGFILIGGHLCYNIYILCGIVIYTPFTCRRRMCTY